MNRKVLAVAVAAAFAAPAALAQSVVQIGGTINIIYDSVRASNNTGGDTAGGANNSMKSHDRVRDGAGSNIRFFVGEDLGGGNQAFVQVESAVVVNSDTRANATGSVAAGVNGWGNRNTAIGIRSKSMGRFLIGVWDVHYDETYGADGGWLIVNSAASVLGLMNNFGSDSINPAIGGRYSNVIKWDSPVWSGFNMSLAYARPGDAAPLNSNASGLDGLKNRAWNATFRYNTGGLHVHYSYLNDKDIPNTATWSAGGTNGVVNAATAAGTATGAFTGAVKVTSNRIGAKYRFGNGFGMGFLWASDKFTQSSPLTAGSPTIDVKRRVTAIPLTFDTGAHSFFFTWAKANDWTGQIQGISWGSATNGAINAQAANTINYGSETGAKLISMGYAYKLSQRTNIGLSYIKITNDALVRYNMFANSDTNASVGADPRSFAFNMRHTF